MKKDSLSNRTSINSTQSENSHNSESVRLFFGFPELNSPSGSYQILNVPVSQPLMTRVETFANALGLKSEIVWIGVYGLLLGRYTECEAAAFGLTVSNSKVFSESLDLEINPLMQELPFFSPSDLKIWINSAKSFLPASINPLLSDSENFYHF